LTHIFHSALKKREGSDEWVLRKELDEGQKLVLQHMTSTVHLGTETEMAIRYPREGFVSWHCSSGLHQCNEEKRSGEWVPQRRVCGGQKLALQYMTATVQ